MVNDFQKRARAGAKRRDKYKPLGQKVHFLVKKELAKQEESKYAIAAYNSTVANTGSVVVFNMPVQGDAYNNRDGDSLQFTLLGGRVTATASDATNIVRLIIFQWLPDSSQDAPTVAKILQDTTTNMAISPFILNRNERKKFKVLSDKVMCVSSNGPAIVKEHIIVKEKSMVRTDFNAGATTGKGILYYLVISDSGAVSHPGLTFDLTYRWRDL